MTALTKARPGSVLEVTRARRPLAANAKVWKGGLAVVALSGSAKGFYQQGAAGDVLAVGRFYEDVDNTGGANGDLSADIHFFRERHVCLWNNDGTAPLAAANREGPCYVLDDQTVTSDSNGNGLAGVVYDVTADGVLVESWIQPRQESSIPNIQSGSTTLISGTKTVTGVKLTSSSIILLTMRDPGSGAITGLGALDAPVASRNTSTGQFVINAIDDSKAVITSAVSTVDWLIIG